MFPGVAELGERPHVGIGVGPITEHVSEIVPENPPCGENVITSLVCPPRFRVRFPIGACIVKSGLTKVAATLRSEFMVNVQELGSLPVHAPSQVVNFEFAVGIAESETEVPAG